MFLRQWLQQTSFYYELVPLLVRQQAQVVVLAFAEFAVVAPEYALRTQSLAELHHSDASDTLPR